MNMLPTGSLQILRGTLRYPAHYGIVIPYPSAENSVMVAVSVRVLGCSGPLCSPRYVIRRILHRYNPPKTPATLSGANRYAIRRESFQVYLLITWLGNWIFLNKIDDFSMVFGEGTRSTVLAQGTIPM